MKLKIENDYLCFDNFVKYKLISKNYEIKTHFTISQKETLMKMMIGLLAERPILLTGDIGTGKTFIVEQLANLVGVNLKVIQFNSETTSLDIIGRLELTINENKVNKLKNRLKIFIEKLIEMKYKKITRILVINKMLDISKMYNFLDGENDDFYNYLNIKDEYNIIKKKLKKLRGIKMTRFTFNLSALIKAMKEGEWVLLDDINFAPQEIEGLMPLLEEEPTLTIYENDPVQFYTKDKTKIKDDNFLIHPNFRLIMSTSKDTNISSAIKSRCLCIKLKPFKEPKDYSELIANNLKYCDIADKNIIDIAEKIGYGFYKLKKEEAQSNYILKNYILSPVNLVNLSKKIISEQPIDEKKLAQTIEFCIFSAFKNNTKKHEIFESFKKSLEKDIHIEITPIRNIKRSHEHILKNFEMLIFSYYYTKNREAENILEKINKKLYKRFNNFKTEIKLDNLIKDIKEESIKEFIQEHRKELLKNLESFTLPEIKEYINDIDEVIVIFQEFLDEKDIIFQYFYFLTYLKKILSKLNILKEEKLYGIKINKMECNKEFFSQYKINEDLSIIYINDLIWFKNMIFYFDAIVPEKISVLNLEGAIIYIYYKYFKKLYVEKLGKKAFLKIFPFIIISSDILKEKAKKFEFYNMDKKQKELFNILKYYDDKIEIDIDKKMINIPKYDFSIYLNEEELIDIKTIKEKLKIQYCDTDYKIFEIKKNIIYYYPKEYYDKQNLFKIFFFFNIFLEDYIDQKELQKILPKELNEFNLVMNLFLKENKNYMENDKKTIWDIPYNFKGIIKIGYELLEAIKKIKKERLFIGIELFSSNELDEENVNKAIEIIEIIKKYINDEKSWSSINEKYKILDEKKRKFIFKNEQNELKQKIKLFEDKYRNILNDDNYLFLKEEIKKVTNQEEFKNLEKKLLQILKSLEQKENIKDMVKENQISNVYIKILYTYSKLNSIIEEFKNINSITFLINRVINFQKLMKKEEQKIDILSAYKEQIFSSCQKDTFVSEKIIEIFKHMANSYLVCEVIKNNIEDKFYEYLKQMMKVEEKIINDIKTIFTDEEYIYFPKLNAEDIVYCFIYGEGNYKSGELNPTDFNQIRMEKNLSKQEYINKLKEFFLGIIGSDNKHSLIINQNLSKINVFYNNMEKIQYDLDLNWLIQPLEYLKKEVIKYPNRIIVKYQMKDSLDIEEKQFNGKNIIVKALIALFEGNKKININLYENRYNQKKIFDFIINQIITDIQISKNDFPFGYRILGFYNFNLFEDYPSKTMMIIVLTINDILNNKFKNYINNDDIILILTETYRELINLVISSEYPKFEYSKAFNFFKIIYCSFLEKFKCKYKEKESILKNNIQKFLKLIIELKSHAIAKLNNKIYD